MTYAFANTGAVGSSNATGSFTLAYPAGITAGDILYTGANWGPTGVTITNSDAGFSLAVSRTTNASTYLWWKVANGTESGTITIARTGGTSGQGIGQMCRFTGGPSSTSGNVHATNSTGLGATTGLAYPSLTVTQPGCLIVTLGCKPFDCSGFNIPSEFDAEIQEANSGHGMCMVWDYKIQTTAANIIGGNWTISTDGSASRNAVIAAFLPGSVPIPFPPMNLGGIGVQMCQ